MSAFLDTTFSFVIDYERFFRTNFFFTPVMLALCKCFPR